MPCTLFVFTRRVIKLKLLNKKRYILIILLFFILSTIVSDSIAIEENSENKVIPLGKLDSLKVTVKFGAGKFNLISGEDDIFEGNFQYDNSILKPNIQYEKLGETGILILSQSIKNDLNLSFPSQNIWDLKLPSDVPLQLYINTATYSGYIDLTNLLIENLCINSGASQTNVAFNQPNLIDLKSINIKTGASIIKMYGLANANFDEMHFSGGVGSYTFDFSGSLNKPSKVYIHAGAAKIVLKIPYQMGIKIIFRNFPTTKLDIKNLIKINEKTFISSEYGKSDAELDIEIRGALLDLEVVSIID
ncbi:MAG TPA: hypothetical protein ENO17_03375 [Candidatus Atribacteria bacterium]|nr:hypothetical protein [Candidatus Atribacteria bacterium]